MPHGPRYFTGEYNCINDERGPCTEDSFEDMRNLNIPDWAKFLRKNGSELIMMLLLTTIVLGTRGKKDKAFTKQ